MQTLRELLDETDKTRMNEAQREAQRQSFAYGNTKFENEQITRATVERASKALHIAKEADKAK